MAKTRTLTNDAWRESAGMPRRVLTVTRQTGTGPVRPGDTYVVREDGEVVGYLASAGQARWRLADRLGAFRNAGNAVVGSLDVVAWWVAAPREREDAR